MKLHFDPNQQFQHDAANAIISIFEGQSLNQGDFSFSISSESYMFQDGGVVNWLEISETLIIPASTFNLLHKLMAQYQKI